jgi:Ca2+-binding RTX toxin-like protein
MNATRFLQAFAGAMFGDSAEARRRRTPSPEVPYPRGVVAGVELLESRRLLTVSITQDTNANVLNISGDSNVNILQIYQVNDSVDEIWVVVDFGSPQGPWYVNADLTLVKVYAEGGDDYVELGTNTYVPLSSDPDEMAVSVPAELHGGYGDDQLSGTDQADDIFGDYGADDLWGAAGNDDMYGGYGDDTDTSDDNLDGDAGDDTLWAEGGNDVLWGDAGADVMYGGAGNDTFHASGDNASDYLGGGDGTDTGTDRDPLLDTYGSIENL